MEHNLGSNLAFVKKILPNTKVNKIVWFFYEGNDYENPRDKHIMVIIK